MTEAALPNRQRPSGIEWLMAFVTGCSLAAFVWSGLLGGGGLVGGDTYPYFFPQKQLMAEAFARGELPLWHDRTSLGYPLLAESQAGILYPPNQILYRFLDVNTAYSFSVLLHYALAFVFTWRFCRSQGLTQSSGLFAAVVFVYGWFPVRISLEWSIIGGVWFPLSLWMTDRLMNNPNFKRWACLVVCLAVHLLAGHFTLAFITQLTCLAWSGLNCLWPSTLGTTVRKVESHTTNEQPRIGWRATALVTAAIVSAALLAAVQLVPTMELRQLSQRGGSGNAFDPAYGHMPPVYLTQLVASWWYWHTPEMALSREMLKYPYLMSSAGTNPVEAHLYAGLIPLILLTTLVSPGVRRFLNRSSLKTWGILSVAGVVYSFGWLVPLFRHLPGFGYFMGPGRYTIISALGLAILAGLALDVLQRRQRRLVRIILTMLATGLTLADVLKSAQYPVCDAQVTAEPPIEGLESSWVARFLEAEDRRSRVRLVAGGPNVANLYGVSSVPQYLGLGPAEYFSPDFAIETQPASPELEFPSPDQMARLRNLAVTHLLTTEPVSHLSEECELVAAMPDSFLNRVWARGPADCFLYRIKQPTPRVTAEPSTALLTWSPFRRHPSDITFHIHLSKPARVRLCELMFPGWEVFIDDQPAEPISRSGIGRFVEVPGGAHMVRWVYQPRSFQIGLIVTTATAVVMAVMSLWTSVCSRS